MIRSAPSSLPARQEGLVAWVSQHLREIPPAEAWTGLCAWAAQAMRRARPPLSRAKLRATLLEAGRQTGHAADAEQQARQWLNADLARELPLATCGNPDARLIATLLAGRTDRPRHLAALLTTLIAHDLDVDANALFNGLPAPEAETVVRATEQLAASPDRPHFHRYRALMILFGLYHADAPEDGGTVYIRSGLAPDNPRADRYYAQARELYVQGIEQKLAAALDARGLRFANGLDDYRLRIPQPLANTTLCVKTGLRIELDSCVGNDHVLVAQDIGATIIHVSILLRDAESGRHDYPIRVHVRRLPEPVLRLGSIDKAVPPTDITSVTEVFSLAPVGAGEWIRLSKAAVVAAGIVPPSLRGRPDAPPLAAFLERLGGGLEIVTDVRGVPVGSGTGTSSAIAAALVAALVKFTGQSRAPLTAMPDDERMLVIARVLLVEQLIGALGGWQDPCVIFPGIKLLTAAPGDFLPAYRPLEVSPAARAELVRRLQLTDGCYRQPSQAAAWQFTGLWVMRLASVYEARMRTRRLVQEQIANLEGGTIERMGPVESADWLNRCAISPKATNPYIERVVELVRQALAPARVDFDASGARGGAGGCFWIDPDDVPAADFADAFDRACRTAMDECRGRIRFEGEPHLYDYAINDRGMEIGLE